MFKVSIIIPVHNTADYLIQSTASVQRQTLQEIEIILVENASTDDSLNVCRQIASHDKRIRVLHLDMGDPSAARNEGIRAASADYVGFIDSDDMIDPRMYETLYDIASKNNLDVVNCNYVRFRAGKDKNGQTVSKQKRYQYCEDGKVHIVSPQELTRLNLMEIISQSPCTMLVRKSIALEHPFPVGKYFEDRATSFRYTAAAKRCAYINKAFYFYYQYRGHICQSKSFKRNHDFAESDLLRLRFIQESKMFEKDQQKVIAAKAAESLLRKINRMRKSITCAEEQAQMNEIKNQISLIPKGTQLSLKARIIRFLIRTGKM